MQKETDSPTRQEAGEAAETGTGPHLSARGSVQAFLCLVLTRVPANRYRRRSGPPFRLVALVIRATSDEAQSRPLYKESVTQHWLQGATVAEKLWDSEEDLLQTTEQDLLQTTKFTHTTQLGQSGDNLQRRRRRM